MRDELVGQLFGFLAICIIISTLVCIAVSRTYRACRLVISKMKSRKGIQRVEVGTQSQEQAVAYEGIRADRAIDEEMQRRAAVKAGRAKEELEQAGGANPGPQTLAPCAVYRHFFEVSRDHLAATSEALGFQGTRLTSRVVHDYAGAALPDGIDPAVIPTLRPASDEWVESALLDAAVDAA